GGRAPFDRRAEIAEMAIGYPGFLDRSPQRGFRKARAARKGQMADVGQHLDAGLSQNGEHRMLRRLFVPDGENRRHRFCSTVLAATRFSQPPVRLDCTRRRYPARREAVTIALLPIFLFAAAADAAPADPARHGRMQTFIAPSGEPFRRPGDEPYPVAAWFA